MTTVFSGASLVLIINWRPAPPEQAQRFTRLCVTAYGLTVLAIVTLFWAGQAPVEQPTLFDAYYATTPYIREMISLYLVAQGVAMMVAGTLCWRWSGKVDGSLRAGLRILAIAYLFIVSYDAIRLTAVTAQWTGHDLDYLVDKISPLFSAPSCLLGALGFAVPLIGPKVAETTRVVKQLWQLQPLWRTLRNVRTPSAVRVTLPWWRTSPAVLLTGRKTTLYDALLALTPHFDPAVREAVYHSVLRNGEENSRAAITADAAMILAARERQRATPGQLTHPMQSPSWRAHDLILLSQALAPAAARNLREYSTPSQKAAHHE